MTADQCESTQCTDIWQWTTHVDWVTATQAVKAAAEPVLKWHNQLTTRKAVSGHTIQTLIFNSKDILHGTLRCIRTAVFLSSSYLQRPAVCLR